MKSNGGILFAGCTIASGFSGVFCDQGYCESWMMTVLSQPQVLTFLGTRLQGNGYASDTRAEIVATSDHLSFPPTGHRESTRHDYERLYARRPQLVRHSVGLRNRHGSQLPRIDDQSKLPDVPVRQLLMPSFAISPLTPSSLARYALSASQVSAGLVAPAAAATVAGTGGAVAILIIVFMAATSAASAELIAVSSIITRDVIGLYRPLSGHKMVVASHITIVVFAVWAGCWSTILNKASVDLGWLFYVQGVLLTPAVIPIGLTVMSRRQSKHAAFFGTLFGTACGMIGWMVGCHKIYGEITITNLALPYSAICGSAPGLIMSGLMTGLICLISTFPDYSCTPHPTSTEASCYACICFDIACDPTLTL